MVAQIFSDRFYEVSVWRLEKDPRKWSFLQVLIEGHERDFPFKDKGTV